MTRRRATDDAAERVRGEARHGLVGEGEDAAGVGEEVFPLRSQAQRAGGAGEEAVAKPLLEAPELQADGGLGEAEALGRAADAAGIGDGGEGADDYLLVEGSGASTIAYGKGDTLVITYDGSKAEPDVDVVQSDGDVQVFVGGELIATLKDTNASDVSFTLRSTTSTQGAGSGNGTGG